MKRNQISAWVMNKSFTSALTSDVHYSLLNGGFIHSLKVGKSVFRVLYLPTPYLNLYSKLYEGLVKWPKKFERLLWTALDFSFQSKSNDFMIIILHNFWADIPTLTVFFWQKSRWLQIQRYRKHRHLPIFSYKNFYHSRIAISLDLVLSLSLQFTFILHTKGY